jgi:SAM-dependent methyltransferase
LSTPIPTQSHGTCLRGIDGSVIVLDVSTWSSTAGPVERRRLADVVGPVLDVGCGPGRLVVALAESGIPALGLDTSPVAVDQAAARSVPVLLRSVFEPLPGTGRWRTALLFDGNIGIGGDPARLLTRIRELLASGGRLVVEVDAPGSGVRRLPVRVERAGQVSDWFPWAQVDAESIGALATAAGFTLGTTIEDEGRWFADLWDR